MGLGDGNQGCALMRSRLKSGRVEAGKLRPLERNINCAGAHSGAAAHRAVWRLRRNCVFTLDRLRVVAMIVVSNARAGRGM